MFEDGNQWQFNAEQPMVLEEAVHDDSSISDIRNQSSSTLDEPLLCRLPERINRGIPKPTYKADPKCKTKYLVSEST